MPLQLVETQRLYQQVADQIGSLIRAGEFGSGARLPPERELARQLGVSRPVVREAMIALEISGLVEVRGGAGAFVRPARPGLDEAGAADPGPSPFDLISARQMLEGEIAFAATAAVTAEDIVALQASIAQMRADIAAGKDSREADRAFHVGIAGITRNAVLVGLVDGMWAQMLAPMFDSLGRHTGLRGQDRMTISDHQAVVDALARRDAEGARQAMRQHLAHVEQILLRDELA
jgi:DNA-binding FadR family transcriptional regulator